MSDPNNDSKTPNADKQIDKKPGKPTAETPKKADVVELDDVTLDDITGGSMPASDCNTGNCAC